MIFPIKIFAIPDIVRHSLVRGFGNDLLVILPGPAHISDFGEFRNQVFGIILEFFPGILHQLDMIVTDGLADPEFIQRAKRMGLEVVQTGC